jgi:ParB-like chromosome segregation protein Spo0J
LYYYNYSIETSAFGKLARYIADGHHRCHAAKMLDLGLDIKVVKLLEDTNVKIHRLIITLKNGQTQFI